ncbi:MAG: tetratricopeptide repeat protein [Chlorobi bacterium]|nr:tetratricopeptide repeat protein [Chlorobiota bacterium]
MKKWLLLLGWIWTVGVAQPSADSLFQQANRLYAEGKYAEASELYKQIEASGKEAAALYYNMGNAAYKQNRLIEAAYYYEKALKINPRLREARENLRTVRRGLRLEETALPEAVHKRLWKKFILQLPAEVWGLLSLIVLYISLAVWLVFMFSPHIRRRKAAFYILPFTTALWLLFLLASYSAEKYHTRLYAVVMEKQAELREEPSLESPVKRRALGGQKVEILEERDHWAKVKLSDGQTYWITRDSYRKL